MPRVKQLEETEAAFHMASSDEEEFHETGYSGGLYPSDVGCRGGPVILCGDFNDTPASYTYRTVKGDLTDGFRDCGSGFGYTLSSIKAYISN